MDGVQSVFVTSRGAHHEAFAVGRVHVLVLTFESTPDEVASVFAARRRVEARYPDGHVAIIDMRGTEGILSLEIRELVGAHVRLLRPGQVRARAVVLPADPRAREVSRAFMTAYFQAPGVRCPDAFVPTVERACAFVAPFVPEQWINAPALVSGTDAALARLLSAVHPAEARGA